MQHLLEQTRLNLDSTLVNLTSKQTQRLMSIQP